MITESIAHKETHSFSTLVTAYLAQKSDLTSFFKYTPNDEGVAKAIADRQNFPVDRKTLVEVLYDQYKNYELTDSFKKQIDSLISEDTFTVCTAHQPDLMTGYLYFFFKIIHTAKLADHLKAKFPKKHFVPVFYIGSEDNDIEELSQFNYNGRKWVWNTKQTGAVGRMSTEDLQPLIKELGTALIPPGKDRDFLLKTIRDAYNGKRNISEAIRYITHTFLGSLGVVVVDADDPRFKKNYIAVMKAELLHPQSRPLVEQTSQELKALNYIAQAYPRDINLFYLKDDVRERIEQQGNIWKVVNTNIQWDSEEALLSELEAHPDRFSPNVILRGPFQETILPDVAFIGGGSEVAYWMQVHKIYDAYKIFFPVLVLRQSAMWMPHEAVRLQEKLGLNNNQLFLHLDEIQNHIAGKYSDKALDISNELDAIEKELAKMKEKATFVDQTLEPASEAIRVRMNKIAHRLKEKMIRARKRQLSDKMRQSAHLKEMIFPEGSLQERHDCFIDLYLKYGATFVPYQYEQTRPWGDRFLIVKDKQ